MSGTGAPKRVRWRRAAVATGMTALVLGAAVAPPDAVQGHAQRLMYLHVPVAWCAYLCFFLVLAASAHYLVRRTDGANRMARAAAETGVVLTGLTLLTGSVWGALTWGTWWVWDARVTTTTAMGLVYLGYLAVRGLTDSSRGRTAAALLGVGGFAMVPLVHFSVLWWRTLHQPPTVLAPSLDPPLHPLMAAALAAAVIFFTVLTAWVLWCRTAALRRASAPLPAATQLSPVEPQGATAREDPAGRRRPELVDL